MSKEIKTISTGDIVGQLPENDNNVLSPDFVLMMDSEAMRPVISIGQPYQLTDGRLVRVTGGTESITANLLTFSLTAQSVCILVTPVSSEPFRSRWLSSMPTGWTITSRQAYPLSSPQPLSYRASLPFLSVARPSS